MKNCKVAVIGAGAAGLTAAYYLKKRGLARTTVFEKQSDVGGKVSTFIHEGRPYEIGAVWMTPDYKTVAELSDELGVRRYPARQMRLMTKDGNVQDTFRAILGQPNLLSLGRDVFRFWKTCAQHDRIKEPGFDGLHSDFHLTLDELSRKRGFPITASLMTPTMSACGYGFYEEVPAQYWMKLMVILLSFALRGGETLNNLWCFSDGYQDLWRRAAEGLDVRLNSPVSSIIRTGSGCDAKVEITANGKTELFDKVIIAAPMEKARDLLDLTHAEQKLFQNIRTLRYIITVARTDSQVHVAFDKNTIPSRIDHVNAALKFHKDTDVNVYFQMVGDHTTAEQALKFLRSDLEEVGVHIREVVHRKEWCYFPHVDKEALSQGYYEKLESLQGERGTYYAGSLLSFETVEHTAAYSKKLVERFF